MRNKKHNFDSSLEYYFSIFPLLQIIFCIGLTSRASSSVMPQPWHFTGMTYYDVYIWISEVHFPLNPVHNISVVRPVTWCELIWPLSFYSQSVLKQQGTYQTSFLSKGLRLPDWWLTYWLLGGFTGDVATILPFLFLNIDVWLAADECMPCLR